MKKFIIIVVAVLAIVNFSGCKKQAWSTEISGGNWVTLISSKGEKIYEGPSEYIDDEYERDALTDSEYNFIWNSDKDEFDKVKRGSCVFSE